MASTHVEAISSFIQGAPPGELDDVVNDIKALTVSDASLVDKSAAAFQKYNEEQLTSVKLPGASQSVLISEHNRLEDGRYFDVESRTSWSFDHITRKASNSQTHVSESKHLDLVNSLYKACSTHAAEYYPTSPTVAVVPSSSETNENEIMLLLTASKYSPSNFWNGRFRCVYNYDPESQSLQGRIQISVHYYEDGNVRLSTNKVVGPITVSGGGGGRSAADAVVREIAKIEKGYHEDLNRGFNELSENNFKALRRQLPVTRQKMEWEKVGSYKAGREIGIVGGRR